MNGESALAGRYQAVMARIQAAALAAGRDPATVRLLAVGKTFGADAIDALAHAGQRAFGENYLQEALEKIDALADRWPAQANERWLEWHFIGPIQSNKTRRIAETFDWVHAVDSLKVARRLSDQRPAALPDLNLCVQINLSDETTKSGCAPGAASDLCLAIAELPRLTLRGLMTIPEATDDAELLRFRFESLRHLLEKSRACVAEGGFALQAKAMDTLSMGMSADLEAAIAEGATIVRVGTALFGERG